ncbi:RICIN domain-containing protein [Phormidesmis sp. 146-12]
MSYITLKRKVQGAIVLYTSLMTLLMGLPAQAASPNQLWYFDATDRGTTTIRSYFSGLCLSGSEFAKNGTIPILQSCNGSLNWSISPTGDGYTYYIRQAKSKYLSIMTQTTADGGWVGLWDGYGGNDQKWYFRGGPREFQLVNYNSGKCLSVANWNPNVGATLVQWTC